MARKLPKGRDIEIPGLDAANSLQGIIQEAYRMTQERRMHRVRPEKCFTAQEYATLIGVAVSTAKLSHLYPLVKEGKLEVIKGMMPGGGRISYYRHIKPPKKSEQGASKEYALATEWGKRKR